MNELNKAPQTVSEPSVLRVENLHKSFSLSSRKLDILKGISLSVERGEFIALRGASGAGKSTLLNLMGGLDKPDLGSVRVEGVELNSLSDSELARVRNRRIGFVFQSYHLLPEFDALENVMMPARIARRDYGEVRERALRLLERVGLSERLGHCPAELSGGEQQRVAIARALINEPVLLIADEPTGNLDSRSGHEVLEVLLELKRELGCTLVMATHDDGVAAIADRIFRIADGLCEEQGI